MVLSLIRQCFFVSGFILLLVVCRASVPEWNVDSREFAQTMTVTGIVVIDGVALNGSENIVGAFYGDECRGVAKTSYDSFTGRYVFYLTIFGNEVGEELHFRVYTNSADESIEMPQFIVFGADKMTGTTAYPFVLSNPPVSSEAIIRVFNADGQYSSVISGSDILLSLPKATDRSAVSVSFTTSEGAYVYINDQFVSEQVFNLDLTTDVEIRIVSADYTTETNYTILAQFVDENETTKIGDSATGISIDGFADLFSSYTGDLFLFDFSGTPFSIHIENGNADDSRISSGFYVCSFNENTFVVWVE